MMMVDDSEWVSRLTLKGTLSHDCHVQDSEWCTDWEGERTRESIDGGREDSLLAKL